MSFISRCKTSGVFFKYEEGIFKPAFLDAVANCKCIGATEPFDFCEATWTNVVGRNPNSPIPLNGEHVYKYFCIQSRQEGLDLLEWAVAVYFVPKLHEIGQGQKLAEWWTVLGGIEQKDGGKLFNSLFREKNPLNYDRLVKKWGAPPFDTKFREISAASRRATP